MSRMNLTRADTVQVGAAYHPNVAGWGYTTSIPAYQDCGALEAASTTNVVNNQNVVTNTNITLANTSGVTFNTVARALQIQSNQNLLGVDFTAYGTDVYGVNLAETITGPNNSTVYGKKAFKSVNRVVPSANGAHVNMGMSSFVGLNYRVDYNTQITTKMDGQVLGVYDAHLHIANQATNQVRPYISDTGGKITAMRFTMAANNANNNSVITLAVNGTTAGNLTVLSNYVCNTVVSNTNLANVYFAPQDIITANLVAGVNSANGTADVSLEIDPAQLTAANTTTANATTGDVRGLVNLGTAPNGTRRFVISYANLTANTNTGLYGITQYSA